MEHARATQSFVEPLIELKGLYAACREADAILLGAVWSCWRPLRREFGLRFTLMAAVPLAATAGFWVRSPSRDSTGSSAIWP